MIVLLHKADWIVQRDAAGQSALGTCIVTFRRVRLASLFVWLL